MAKFDPQNPQRINNLDYNAIRAKVVNILGPGTGQSGYGQPIFSQPVFQGNTITKAQWDALRADLYNIRYHQTGLIPSIVSPALRTPIAFGSSHPNTAYDISIEQSTASKFNLAANQSITSAKASQSRTGSWNTYCECTVTVTFASADKARWFFNSGSKLRFSAARTGGSSTSQNNSWTNLLNGVGIVEFGAITPQIINFYSLTDEYQIFRQTSDSGIYSANFYRLEARCDVENNIAGGATVLTFRIGFSDLYEDVSGQPPPDLVDGTLRVDVSEIKAAGTLIPSGLFEIDSPTYLISSIIVSDPTPLPPTYSIVPSSSTVVEGNAVTFSITTSNLLNGTVLYWTTNTVNGTVIASDFVDNALTGSIIITGNVATITRRISAADGLTEGDADPDDEFTLSLRTGSISGPVVATSAVVEIVDTPPTYSIIANTTLVYEGDSVTFSVTTTSVANGTVLYWTVLSTQGDTATSDFADGLTSGTVVINNNSGAIIRQVTGLDGDEPTPNDKFRIQLRTESISGTVVANSQEVEIVDVEPTYTIAPSASSVVEGNSVTFTVTTTNVLNGTVLYWTTTSTQNNTSAADFTDNAMSGTVTINSNIGIITRTLVAGDGNAEPNDKFTISVRTGSSSGPIKATSSQVEIIDVEATFSIAPNLSTVNEGSSVIFTVTTTLIANGSTLYWTLGGTANGSDFSDSASSGTVIINGNSGTITRTLRNDLITDGPENFFLRLRTGSTSGTIVATSSTVSINDTSRTPAGQQEFTTALGTDYTFNVPTGVTTLNVVIVGGGAGGGYSNRRVPQNSGGGGGSGGYYTGTISVPLNNNPLSPTVLGIRVGERGLGSPKNPQGSNSTGVTSPRLTTELFATDGSDSYITLPGVSPSLTPFKATGGKRGGNAVFSTETPGTAGAGGLPAGGSGTAGQTVGNSNNTTPPLFITGTAAGGQGGSNPLGNGGVFSASTGNVGTGYGAGGSGAGVNQVTSNTTEAAYAGGNGTGGYIRISWN